MGSHEPDPFEEIVRGLSQRDPKTPLAGGDPATLPASKRPSSPMPEGWYVIRVELISGRDLEFDQPPGRDLLVSPQHTFRQLADALNACFARWDPGHLYAFKMPDGSRIGTEHDEYAEHLASRTKIGRREMGETFEYEFDFGDSWMHRCLVTAVGVDPEEAYGRRPKGPVPIWGWGDIPDQYGRTTPDGEDQEEED